MVHYFGQSARFATLTYPELVSWDFESFTDIPELIQHAHLDNISF
ncbi:MAG: hypothetical protein ACLSAH_03240 [Bilophila wadsworthia]